MKQGGLRKDILLLKRISNLPISATLIQETISAHLNYCNSLQTIIPASTPFFAIYLQSDLAIKPIFCNKSNTLYPPESSPVVFFYT